MAKMGLRRQRGNNGADSAFQAAERLANASGFVQGDVLVLRVWRCESQPERRRPARARTGAQCIQRFGDWLSDDEGSNHGAASQRDQSLPVLCRGIILAAGGRNSVFHETMARSPDSHPRAGVSDGHRWMGG